MTKRRHKPSSPEEARKKLAELEERKAEKRRLEAQGVHVVTDPAHRIVRAVRKDCFEVFLSRGVISQLAYNAVRRLEEQIAFSTGALRNEQGFDRVDTTTLGQNITDSMINASKIVDAVLRCCGPVNARLLRALLEPEPNRPGHGGLLTRWRDVAEAVTGETNDRAQTASIRQACENLAEAWRMMDYGRAA